jgi:hypothetical protein
VPTSVNSSVVLFRFMVGVDFVQFIPNLQIAARI